MLWGILTSIADWPILPVSAKEFFQSEEFLISSASLALVSLSMGIGWWVKSITTGHREAKLQRLFGDWEMTKVARRRRQEDAVYEAISGLVYKGVFGSREAKRLFRLLATKGGLEGLCIPAKEYQKLHLYQMAKLKAKTEASTAKLQAEGPLPLPKEEPKEVPKTKTNVVRKFVTRVKTRVAA